MLKKMYKIWKDVDEILNSFTMIKTSIRIRQNQIAIRTDANITLDKMQQLDEYFQSQGIISSVNNDLIEICYYVKMEED